ncbi:hypothetical protein Tco_0078465 [Tanacetum coccineum]
MALDTTLLGYIATTHISVRFAPNTIATRDSDSKRKWEDEQEGNHRQQQNKRQEVGRVYVARTGKGHTKRYCPGLENQNGDEEARQNLDIVTGTFLFENRYIPVLNNANANRSFVFTDNSHLNDVALNFSFT